MKDFGVTQVSARVLSPQRQISCNAGSGARPFYFAPHGALGALVAWVIAYGPHLMRPALDAAAESA